MPRKKKKIIFVDGYNIIYSWPELKILMEDSLEEAREKLISEMQEYQKLTGVIVFLVFDSYREKRPLTTEEKRGNITVVYTKEYETADSYIERACNLLGKDEEVRVATSDFTLQDSSLGSGATRVSSREFKHEYDSIKDRTRDSYERKNLGVKQNIGSLSEEQIKNIEELEKKLFYKKKNK